MKKGYVDILLATNGKRLNGLIYQCNAILNQSYKDLNLYVLLDCENHKEVADAVNKRVVNDDRLKFIVVPLSFSGSWGHPAMRYAIEYCELEGEWVVFSGDDDCMTEWCIQSLIDSSLNVDMVIGKVIPVCKNNDAVFIRKDLPVNYVLGCEIEMGKITGSNCMYRLLRLKELGYSDSVYTADWELIKKFVNYPFKMIDTVLFVMPQNFNNANKPTETHEYEECFK